MNERIRRENMRRQDRREGEGFHPTRGIERETVYMGFGRREQIREGPPGRDVPEDREGVVRLCDERRSEDSSTP